MKKVSVAIITYNHEKYIEKAIQSVLVQKTSFTFEIIVSDDCSGDRTQAVIQKLHKENPDCIVPVLRKKNVGMKLNSIETLKFCKGEYVAFLEGDDFWTDSQKLQKQVDFLDQHKDYAAIYHACKVIDHQETEIELPGTFTVTSEYQVNDMESYIIPGQTSTVLARNFWKEDLALLEMLNKVHYSPLDRIVPLLLLSEGRIYCMQEKMSVYRYLIGEKGSWSYKFQRGNYLWRAYAFAVHREIEKMARQLHILISYRKLESKLYSDYIVKGLVWKRPRYFFLAFFMILFGTHRIYMLFHGNQILYARLQKKIQNRYQNRYDGVHDDKNKKSGS